MTKTDLINHIAERAGLTKVDARKAFEATLETIVHALRQGEKVAIPGFGTWETAERAERQGTNPATGQPITIPKKTVVKFKPGTDLSL